MPKLHENLESPPHALCSHETQLLTSVTFEMQGSRVFGTLMYYHFALQTTNSHLLAWYWQTSLGFHHA